MKYIGLFFLASAIWIIYELWSAPLAEETENGGFKIIKPGKKLSDLFKNKNKSGSYSDLEKRGRGRSKF